MSAIKLSTPSSGSISLSPADTASNLTITVPAVSGTMATVDGSGNASVTGNLSFNSGYGSSAVAYGCRAWVNFNGTGTVAIRASGNVSSITDAGEGTYVVNLTTALPDMNGSISLSSWTNASNGFNAYITQFTSTSNISAYTYGVAGGGVGAYRDTAQVYVAVFR